MNPLYLSGYGVKLKLRSLRAKSELEITNGREDDRPHSVASFRPRRFPYSSVSRDLNHRLDIIAYELLPRVLPLSLS